MGIDIQPTMRYKVTKEIVEALRNAIGSEWGAISSYSKKAGVHNQMISSLLKGKHTALEEGTWMRLVSATPILASLATPMSNIAPVIDVRQVNRDHASGVQNIRTYDGVDAYRVRVQDRLLEESDPVPVKRVLRIMKEEAQ